MSLKQLSSILPLDDESLTEILNYTATLSKEEGAEHLKNLLGDSPAAFEFISAFNARRGDPTSASSSTLRQQETSRLSPSETPSPSSNSGPGRKNKKTKPPLHSAGPVRRPADFGNVAGGYKKADMEQDYMSERSGVKALDVGLGSSSSLRVPSHQGSAASSRGQSPDSLTGRGGGGGKAPPSATGPVISDLLPNVKSKAAKHSRAGGGSSGHGTVTPKGSRSLTTNNISDLTAAIAALEVSTNPTLSTERRKCTCYGTLHPVFDAAPNCLNCGKIICSLEGLQPCSFCGTPLLSNDEIQSMIRELRAERGQEKMRAHNESQHREGGPGMAAGSSQSQSSSKLEAAKAHRDKLLQFQAQNAKRTRVVDEAADFETPSVASTLWMTPSQRALALKKQQRIMREMEEKARPEWEKKKTIMSLDIKGGRVRRVYQTAPAETSAPVEDEETEDLTYDVGRQRSGGEALSRNPLLAAGGLMRPVWKASEKKEKKGEPKERKQTWRRVQDDRDDNEQWILDGGLHGYTEPTLET
ncbi:C2HC5-type zinc finger protein [Aspergillus foveolatus]|uniref:C2HC5-type zinc finger protein n=1 Tax=Aspergillus foveolatus TaxID=210207 RepID=UPI003CCD74D8